MGTYFPVSISSNSSVKFLVLPLLGAFSTIAGKEICLDVALGPFMLFSPKIFTVE